MYLFFRRTAKLACRNLGSFFAVAFVWIFNRPVLALTRWFAKSNTRMSSTRQSCPPSPRRNLESLGRLLVAGRRSVGIRAERNSHHTGVPPGAARATRYER